MKENSTLRSGTRLKKCAACGVLLDNSQKTTCACDTGWNTSLPYPTWPFTRVRGSELTKLQQQMKARQPTDFEEAPL